MRFQILISIFTSWYLPAFALLPGRTIEVHGHRGARGYFPENTLPAFNHALKVGVDVIELDTGITKDDQVIISHDPYINPARCLDKHGKPITSEIILNRIKLKDAKEFDCGTLKNSDFPKQVSIPNTEMPTLDELFEVIKNSDDPKSKTVRFNIETKIRPENSEWYVTPKKFAKLLYKVIKKHKMEKRVIIQSFDFRTLTEIKKLNKDLAIAALLHEEPENLTALVQGLKPRIVSPNAKWIKENHIKELKKVGIKVIPYTVNQESQWKAMIKIGADGIITDYPDDLINFLGRVP